MDQLMDERLAMSQQWDPTGFSQSSPGFSQSSPSLMLEQSIAELDSPHLAVCREATPLSDEDLVERALLMSRARRPLYTDAPTELPPQECQWLRETLTTLSPSQHREKKALRSSNAVGKVVRGAGMPTHEGDSPAHGAGTPTHGGGGAATHAPMRGRRASLVDCLLSAAGLTAAAGGGGFSKGVDGPVAPCLMPWNRDGGSKNMDTPEVQDHQGPTKAAAAPAGVHEASQATQAGPPNSGAQPVKGRGTGVALRPDAARELDTAKATKKWKPKVTRLVCVLQRPPQRATTNPAALMRHCQQELHDFNEWKWKSAYDEPQKPPPEADQDASMDFTPEIIEVPGKLAPVAEGQDGQKDTWVSDEEPDSPMSPLSPISP